MLLEARGTWSGMLVSSACNVHTDVTLTRSKVKVKVTRLLIFRKLHFSKSISCASLPRSSKLMVDYGSMGPGLQLVRARFLHFSPTWRLRDIEVHEMLISPESTGSYLHTA